MIVEAIYKGPYPEVTVPGFRGKTVKKGEPVKLRTKDGHVLGGCWRITKGEAEYEKAREAFEKMRTEKKAAREARREQMRKTAAQSRAKSFDDEAALLVERGEIDATASKPAAKRTAKTGDGEG